MSTVRTGIYARISDDEEGLELGVKRQVDDCTAEAQRRGWPVTTVYVENDVSATRSKVRPKYERLISDIKSGAITALVVWDVDRLTRTPRELEDLIDLADTTGLQLANCGGEINLSTPQGRMTARIKGTVARHETEQMSRRIRRKFDENARDGKPHGKVPYGWDRIDGQDVINPEQADIIREVADRLLHGESMRSIWRTLNDSGRMSPKGKPWDSTTLRQVMLRERNAGLRVHRGEVVGKGKWKRIYSEDTHIRIKVLLTDPDRRTTKGNERKHLGTGIYRCGREGCDGTVKVNTIKDHSSAYYCPTCHKIRRRQSDVDDLVNAEMTKWLQDADVASVVTAGEPEHIRAAKASKAALEARLDEAVDLHSDGKITGSQLARSTAKLTPQIEVYQAVLEAYEPQDVLAYFMDSDDITKAWSTAPLDVRRSAIKALLTVTILPTTSGQGGYGRAFDPDSVEITLSGGIRELIEIGGWEKRKRVVAVSK